VKEMSTVSGTLNHVCPVTSGTATSAAPRPQANAPMPPAEHVWLSAPTTICPGCARCRANSVCMMVVLGGWKSVIPVSSAKSCESFISAVGLGSWYCTHESGGARQGGAGKNVRGACYAYVPLAVTSAAAGVVSLMLRLCAQATQWVRTQP
jgi:hypothetical protein